MTGLVDKADVRALQTTVGSGRAVAVRSASASNASLQDVPISHFRPGALGYLPNAFDNSEPTTASERQVPTTSGHFAGSWGTMKPRAAYCPSVVLPCKDSSRVLPSPHSGFSVTADTTSAEGTATTWRHAATNGVLKVNSS